MNYGPAPILMSGGLEVASVTAGGDHVCAVTVSNDLLCWGDNGFGQLGDGTTDDRATPTAVNNFEFAKASAGGQHTCALTAGAETLCWGNNSDGQTGIGTVGGRVLLPTRVSNDVRCSNLAAGTLHTCAMTSEVRDGGKPVHCWGSNALGQLGRSITGGSPLSAEVAGEFAFRAITAGRGHTCGVVHNVEFSVSQSANNIGYCWGSNEHGQSGSQSPLLQLTAPDSVRFNRQLEGIAAGGAHTCAISGRQAFCWGANDFGQLGNDTTAPSDIPTVVRKLVPPIR